MSTDREKALEMALAQIDKQYGKGSIMRMGEKGTMAIQAVPTGALPLDLALGVGGLPRGRVVEIYGPESSGKTTLCLSIIAEVQRKGGNAVFAVAGTLVEKAKAVAARLLEANEADVVLDTDRAVFHVAGTPAVTKSWADLAVAEKQNGGLSHDEFIGVPSATFPFGAHVAVVVADEPLGVHAVDALTALLVGRGHPVDHGVGRPGHRLGAFLGRARHDLELVHRRRAVTVRGAEAVGPGVATADDHDVLALR